MNRAVLLLVLCAAGAYASEYNCDAQSKVCLNGGLCHDNVQNSVNGPLPGGGSVTANGWMDPTCICAAPFAGQFCQYTVRECKDSPCKNGATCVPADCQANTAGPVNQYVNGQWAYDCFKCLCAPGWTASPIYPGNNNANPNGLCDTPQPINDCTNNQCLNGGTCNQQAYSNGVGYNCACAAPWSTGGRNGGGSHLNCTYNCNSATPCLNGGSCNTVNGFCTCPNGYYGNQCEFTAACMAAGYCQNGGTCHTNTGTITGVCVCAAPYSGTQCQTRACDSNPCQNGGTCNNNVNGFTCTCPPITGVPNSALSPTCGYFCQSGPCLNSATCFNLAGGTGQCACAVGFAGPTCSRAINFGCGQPFSSCVSQNVQSNSPLVLNNGCPCRNQATCAQSNFDGRCSCRGSEGYNPFTAAALPTGLINSGETFAYDCRCNTTYTPRCPAGNQALTFTTQGTYVNQVCQNGGVCIEWAEGAGCACRPGFWGTTCQNYDNPCLNSPCQNQGACQIVQESGTAFLGEVNTYPTAHVTPALDDRFWGYMCQCKWPYYGEHCENVAPSSGSYCPTPDPCMNGGSCGPNNAAGPYWTGNSVGIQTWYPRYGVNNQPQLVVGNLMAPAGNYLAATLPYGCTCTANYTGSLCQTKITSCTNTPGYCLNGGTCSDSSTPFNFIQGSLDGSVPYCMCPCGYAGDRCEIMASNAVASALASLADVNGGVGYRLNFCAGSPCQNGGTCVNALSGQTFYCQCKSGWGDRYCQTRVRSAAAGVAPSIVVAAAAILAAFALRN